ncbi:MAG: hypothetical protein ACTSRC_10805 [Candidatus Helarchaeota archaeon]
MQFDFLKPLTKSGFKKLEITTGGGRITRFFLKMRPQKLSELISGELEIRTEIQLTLGSDLLTYGLDKFLLLFQGLTGQGNKSITSTLKYSVVRVKPEMTEAEKAQLEKLYYKKVNAPIRKFLTAVGPRVRKAREFLRDADKFIKAEAREVATKEIVDRVVKTTEDFGIDRITRFAGNLLSRVAEILEDSEIAEEHTEEYQAVILKKRKLKESELKPQLIIMQRGNSLRIMGGSKFDDHCEDIHPELLYDTLRRYLLTKKF